MPVREPRSVRFAGYAAVFDHVDRGRDVVRSGAFTRTLAKGVPIPLLWQHRSGAVIGQVERLEEDQKGLRVIGSLNGSDAGQKAARLVQARRVDGLSFGYRVKKASEVGGVRELTDVDLLEVSIVSRPMQPKARIHAIRAD